MNKLLKFLIVLVIIFSVLIIVNGVYLIILL